MIDFPEMSDKILFIRARKVREHCVLIKHGFGQFKLISSKNYNYIWERNETLGRYFFEKDLKRAVNAAAKAKHGMKWKKVVRKFLKFKK